jgi:hypothetical protein
MIEAGRKRSSLAVAGIALALGSACSVGEGEGSVTSERLFVEDCWDGAFELNPSFFGANPFRDTMQIRVQRGGEIEDVSDGLMILLSDTALVRENLGQDLLVGLPRGVTPPGLPEGTLYNGANVHLSLYLNETCHLQNSTIHSIDGTIRFDSLFSGDPNEDNSDRRLTEAEFSAVFVDPREAIVTSGPGVSPLEIEYPEERLSRVSGSFRFFFHRGSPAQPFP